MNNYDIFRDELEDNGFDLPHLPLDWNEEMSLEEYIQQMEDRAEQIQQSI